MFDIIIVDKIYWKQLWGGVFRTLPPSQEVYEDCHGVKGEAKNDQYLKRSVFDVKISYYAVWHQHFEKKTIAQWVFAMHWGFPGRFRWRDHPDFGLSTCICAQGKQDIWFANSLDISINKKTEYWKGDISWRTSLQSQMWTIVLAIQYQHQIYLAVAERSQYGWRGKREGGSSVISTAKRCS